MQPALAATEISMVWEKGVSEGRGSHDLGERGEGEIGGFASHCPRRKIRASG